MDRTLSFQSAPEVHANEAAPRSRPLFQFGLQGKLVCTLLGMVFIALGSSCWLFAQQNDQQISEMMGQQARLVAYTLSLASAPLMSGRNRDGLRAMESDLLKAHNILYIAYYDANKKPIALANRYADFSWKDVSPLVAGSEMLVMSQPQGDSFGPHLDVYSRVYGKDQKVLGYVLVGVSLDQEQEQATWVNWLVLCIGAAVVLLSLPIGSLLVYGIFKPIRELVEATKKMSAGRLDIQVETERKDLIGDLARSFQHMVEHVRKQREALATSNSQLADANEQLGLANKALHEANRDLEKKVQQRTGQLESANLRLQAEIAEKEDFVRAVSHDLNAPLRNIDGMAALLLSKHREDFTEEVTHRLERIQKNVQVETDLISELLELSRIKTQRQEIEPVDVEALVSDLKGVFEEDLRSRQIQMMLDTPLPPLIAEKSRIRQVFQNLIDNAIKYMGEQTIREIHVGCEVAGDEAQFYVRDTGMGIEADDLGKVFFVFRRGRGAASQNVPGKGIGLSSVKSIVETYSGSIWVESHVGEGSIFRFTINGRHVCGPDGQPLVQAEDPQKYGSPNLPADRRAA